MDTRHQQYRRNWAWVGLAAASFLALAAFGWQEGTDPSADETREICKEPAAPARPAGVQASTAWAAANTVSVPLPAPVGTAEAPRDRPQARRSVSMVGADWGHYPSGLMDAIAQALHKQDGPGAYELARILERCEGLPQKIEQTRQQLSELQAQGVLQHKGRGFVQQLMAILQRDQAHCQTLSGDARLQRRQLLEVAVRQGVDGAGMTLFSDGV